MSCRFSLRVSIARHRPGSAGGRLALVLGATALLCSCASQLPAPLREAPLVQFPPTAVQQDPGRTLGQRVRWGGSIIAVINKERDTLVEVLAKPLDREGRPRGDASAEGRFIARLAGFVDPETLPAQRALTVAGRVVDLQTRSVGEYPYRYPVVEVDARHLWAPLPVVVDYPWGPPGWPWYDPWWGPRFGPWWRPGFRYRH